MNVQPIIQREARVASRRPETWRLRFTFAGGALAAFVFGLLWPDVSPANKGQVVLICLCVCGFFLSLVAGPYLTADAISEETREGTLGLLFLTPLNAWQIITGKMVTHALQVGYGWVAGFPIFFLPVLMGGVVSGEVVRVLFVLLVTLLLSVSCGLFWSTLCTEARTSVMATLASLLLLVFLPWLGVFLEELTHGVIKEPGSWMVSPMTALVFSFESAFNRRAYPGLPWSGADVFWTSSLFQLALAAVLLVVATLVLPKVLKRAGATPMRSSASERAASGKRRSTPRWVPPVSQSPLIWLFGRGLRVSGWLRLLNALIWVFFVLTLLLSATDAAEQGFITAFCLAYARHMILKVQFAFDATRQLQEDRSSGALELLLTTPVNVAELARAYGTALRRSSRWALLTTLAMNGLLEITIFALFDHLYMDDGAWLIFSVWFLGGVVLAPADLWALTWLAFRQAARPRSQVKAVGIILATLHLPAWVGFGLMVPLTAEVGNEGGIGLLFVGWMLACLGYNAFLVWSCKLWLRGDLRHHVAEGG